MLAVDAVTRQYLPAVILGFAATGFDDVRLTVAVDDIVSTPHDQALAEAGGTAAMKIRVEPSVGEPALPPQLAAQRAPHDTVRGLQRRADTTPAVTEPGTVLAADDEDAAAARAELAALTVRSVPSSNTQNYSPPPWPVHAAGSCSSPRSCARRSSPTA
ncbi:hypothetical protein BS329_39445 [Amycolatopsis coloradensis]|uniref:Uncharacterized protein n=1 Tax=Amycolatopsis coloradensis TaxID=76021 RepID=A0A1R0KEC2_9PSEU|nr:hypothetical protein [Amycolatopsis coloradensis]OLZ43399.1 hypothetical protein BS329_39445 [Amycolatopsis coloradensis]